MSKLALATKLADELGSTVDEAYRFVEEVGAGVADDAAAAADEAGDELVANWWMPAAGVGAIGGGALYWREQNIERAQAIAQQQQSFSAALASIMESDLPPARKRELVEDLMESAPSQGGDGDGGGGGGGGSLIPDLFGGGIKQTIVLMLVLIFALNFALGGGE